MSQSEDARGPQVEEVRSRLNDLQMRDVEPDPLDVDTRKCQVDSNGASVNLTDTGKRVLDLQQGLEMEIRVFRRGIWIEPKRKTQGDR